MQIKLTAEVEALLDLALSSGRYESSDEVLAAALHALFDQTPSALAGSTRAGAKTTSISGHLAAICTSARQVKGAMQPFAKQKPATVR